MHGLVKRRQEGNMAYFSIGTPFVFDLCNSVCTNMQEEWQERQSVLGGNG